MVIFFGFRILRSFLPVTSDDVKGGIAAFLNKESFHGHRFRVPYSLFR